jgi:hypothetical protein
MPSFRIVGGASAAGRRAGRIIVRRPAAHLAGSTLRFILLNAANCFAPIIAQVKRRPSLPP